jgi:hypothetical protein
MRLDSKEPALVVNMDDPEVKRRLMLQISALRGLWELDLKPRKLVRNLQQNKYYWVAVVMPFRDWLREAYGDSWITSEQAHEMLKERILSGRETNLGTIPPTTTKLNTKEFAEYVDNAAAWLAEFTGIVVIPSDLFLLKEAKKRH